MENLLITTILLLCDKAKDPKCAGPQDYMVNCVIRDAKEIKLNKIEECAKAYKNGKRYQEPK